MKEGKAKKGYSAEIKTLLPIGSHPLPLLGGRLNVVQILIGIIEVFHHRRWCSNLDTNFQGVYSNVYFLDEAPLGGIVNSMLNVSSVETPSGKSLEVSFRNRNGWPLVVLFPGFWRVDNKVFPQLEPCVEIEIGILEVDVDSGGYCGVDVVWEVGCEEYDARVVLESSEKDTAKIFLCCGAPPTPRPDKSICFCMEM